MKRIRSAAVLGLIAVAATIGASAVAAGGPRIGTYAGETAGDVMQVEILKREGTFRARLLRLDDDCAPDFLLEPVAIGKNAKLRRFHATIRGDDRVGIYTAEIVGRFTSPTRIAATVHTTAVRRKPPKESLPNCPKTTRFSLEFLPDGL